MWSRPGGRHRVINGLREQGAGLGINSVGYTNGCVLAI